MVKRVGVPRESGILCVLNHPPPSLRSTHDIKLIYVWNLVAVPPSPCYLCIYL